MGRDLKLVEPIRCAYMLWNVPGEKINGLGQSKALGKAMRITM